MAGQSIAAASSQAWASMGSQAETALNSGWLLDQTISSTGGLLTAAAPSTLTAFLSSGDGTTGSGNSFWAVNRLVRVVHNTGTAYASIQASSYTAPVTTVTLNNYQTGGTTSLSTVATASFSAAASPVSMGLGIGNDYTKVRILNRTTTTVVASTASVTSDSTMYTFSVPAGVMGTSGILRLSMYGDLSIVTSSAISPGFKLIFGGTTILAGSTADSLLLNDVSTRYWTCSVVLQNVSASNSQRAFGEISVGPAPASAFCPSTESNMYYGAGYGTATEGTSANVAISFVTRLASTNSGLSMNLRHALLELIQ